MTGKVISNNRKSPCISYGDINNDGYVTENDSKLVANYVSYPGNPLYVLSSEQKLRADVTADKKVNIGDALAIANYAAGYSTTFKVCSTR